MSGNSVRSLALIGALSAAGWSSAQAGSYADCDLIHDSASRSLCRASISGNGADCGGITNNQAWRSCLAIASGKRGDCEALQSSDERAACRALSR